MKVKLLKSLEDKGIKYEVGDVLETDKYTAEWLVSNKIAEPDTAPVVAAKK